MAIPIGAADFKLLAQRPLGKKAKFAVQPDGCNIAGEYAKTDAIKMKFIKAESQDFFEHHLP